MPVITDPLKRRVRYTDIDLSFLPNPVTHDVSVKMDETAVKQSMETLVRTMFFEKPFHPEIGSDVQKLLFEPISPLTEIMLKDGIINTITNWEPRVDLIDVSTEFRHDYNEVTITITYKIKNTIIPLTAQFILYRSR